MNILPKELDKLSPTIIENTNIDNKSWLDNYELLLNNKKVFIQHINKIKYDENGFLLNKILNIIQELNINSEYLLPAFYKLLDCNITLDIYFIDIIINILEKSNTPQQKIKTILQKYITNKYSCIGTFNYIDLIFLFLSAFMLFIFSANDYKIRKVEGIILLIIFAVYYTLVLI